jgi:uncharacterized protein YxjI
MHEILNRNLFLVKEHVGMFKAANNYDIHNPETGEVVLHCREEHLGFLTKMFRFSKYKTMTPFDIEIRTPDGQPIVRVKRGVSFFLSKVQVLDEAGQVIGGFKQKFAMLKSRCAVLDADEQPVCELEGNWSGWEFKFVKDGVEFAQVSKKWAGIGKEFFTSADNYALSISESVPPNNPIRQLILAAVMCIDMVLKER